MKRLAASALAGLMAATVLTSVALAEMTVTRGVFARSVTAREPDGAADRFPANVGKVIYFNQLSGVSAPEEITHMWKYADKVELEVKLSVEEEGWRVWSVKEIPPSQTGVWTVQVLDKSGNVLETATFMVDR